MKLPIKKETTHIRSLEEIRQRKEQLLSELEKDNTKFSTLWDQIFIKREGNTKGEFVSGLIANSVTAIDVFLLIRKLRKNYGSLFGKTSSTKKKKKR
jgi:hypothetical protein